jgi:hypothetical protein
MLISDRKTVGTFFVSSVKLSTSDLEPIAGRTVYRLSFTLGDLPVGSGTSAAGRLDP